MRYIDFECRTCCHKMSVDEVTASRLVHCPVCGSFISAAESSSAPPDSPEVSPADKFRLRRGRMDEAAGSGQAVDVAAEESGEPRLRVDRARSLGGDLLVCPSCGAAMDPGGRICSMCGYNTVTGHSVTVERARRERIRRWVARGIVVAALLVMGRYAWRKGWYPRAGPSKMREQLLQLWGELDRATQPSERAVAEPFGRTDEEIALIAAAHEETVRRQLDEAAAPLIRGQPVELELLTGRVLTGIFRGLKRDHITLLEVEGVLEEIPHDALCPMSRVRVDEAFREQWVRAEARRRVGEIPQR